MRTAAIVGVIAAAAVLLALACDGCGGSSFSSSSSTDAGAGDVADSRVISDEQPDQVEASADAPSRDAQGGLDAGEASADASKDAAAGDACKPERMPPAMPPGCQCESAPQGNCGADARGCVWVSGSSSTCASSCWLYPVPGSGSCASCSWSCSCIAPLLAGAGLGQCQCIEGPSGPYLGGC
jgi:hypothetical protein